MNPQAFQLKAPFWDAKLSPFWVRLTRPWRRRDQIQRQRLLQVEVRGLERLRRVVEEGAGVLITPNHPGHADSHVLCEAAEALGRPVYFMTAWQVFAMAPPFRRWIFQRNGCFSIEREGADLRAFKRAVQILSEAPYPLVIFPEGEVYHINDRITPLREGTAAIALTAAKHARRPVVVVPCAFKYVYLQNPTPELDAVMTAIEEHIHWRARRDLPLPERVYRFADAMLGLKELEYLGRVQTGPLPARVHGLLNHVLTQLEGAYGQSAKHQTVPERVKNVRRACLEAQETADDPLVRAKTDEHLADLFLVIQLWSYPGDYVAERPTIERLAETIDKFEEDVLGFPTARIRGTRRAVLAVGEPLDVSAMARDGGSPRQAARPLTDQIEHAIQDLLDGINRSLGSAPAEVPAGQQAIGS